MRLETGRKSEAVLARSTVVIAKRTGLIRSRTATASTTGVSSTAVVSRESTAVLATATATRPDPDAAYGPVRGVDDAVGDEVEEAQAGAQLGEHGREHEEQEDRSDPCHQVGRHNGAGYAGVGTTTVAAWQQRRQRWSSPGGARCGCPPRTG